jgi:hypothetical protein
MSWLYDTPKRSRRSTRYTIDWLDTITPGLDSAAKAAILQGGPGKYSERNFLEAWAETFALATHPSTAQDRRPRVQGGRDIVAKYANAKLP